MSQAGGCDWAGAWLAGCSASLSAMKHGDVELEEEIVKGRSYLPGRGL